MKLSPGFASLDLTACLLSGMGIKMTSLVLSARRIERRVTCPTGSGDSPVQEGSCLTWELKGVRACRGPGLPLTLPASHFTSSQRGADSLPQWPPFFSEGQCFDSVGLHPSLPLAHL